jgi:glycerate 2-kinase
VTPTGLASRSSRVDPLAARPRLNTRRTLLDLFDAALRAVDGRACVARFLRDANVQPPVEVFAIGKAASSMAMGARDALGSGIERMLAITKIGHSDPSLEGPGVYQLESPHPMPDIRSLSHGSTLERQVEDRLPGVLPLFLISGGSSSLVEALREGVSLGDVWALNVRGLAAGWDIATLNAERAKLSRIKQGGIARLLDGRRALALFISDVPGDDPDVIGSGLLGRDHGAVDAVERHVVANVERAVAAAVAAGEARGLRLATAARRFDGDAAQVARAFVEELRTTGADGLVWGGESTVTLPAAHGRGGRNTHLALHAARLLRAGEPLQILSAGTDGTDGPTGDAGACVDAGTLERAELAGVDVERALAKFDSGTAIEAAEDLVHTGPTGTNVGDILIGLKLPAARVRGHSTDPVL